MKEYDVVVIGSGSGLSLVSKALEKKLRVALVADKYLGGTCFNVGCMPSKMLIHVADRVMEINEAGKLGVKASISAIDFPGLMERVRQRIRQGVEFHRGWVGSTEGLDFYESKAHFVGEYTLETDDGRRIGGKKIFIASGASPAIPPVEGLREVSYLTNESLLELTHRPESLIIIGGGYIAVEYGHFFSAMGTKVTIVEMADHLVAHEEPEVCELLEKRLMNRMSVQLKTKTAKVSQSPAGCVVQTEGADGATEDLVAETVLVATGRKSNAPSLTPEKSGIELNKAGFVTVDDYLQATKENVWAVGDATGKQMFTHAADKDVEIAWHNATNDTARKVKMNFSFVPHAVFTYPQIASIGLREAEARKSYDVVVGRALYSDTVQGELRLEEDTFAKAVVDKKSGQILGFHVIGPEAPELIQEVVNAMTTGMTAKAVIDCIHIFPAMSELITETLSNLE